MQAEIKTRGALALAPPSGIDEKYWTVLEIAKRMQWSRTTIERLFQDEPGVIRLTSRRLRSGVRPYVTLRIPNWLLERKLRELEQ